MHIVPSARTLRDWLRENGLTHEWLASVLGTTQPTIYRWVTGEFRPDTHFRKAIHYLSCGKVDFDGWFYPDEQKLAWRYKRKKARDNALSASKGYMKVSANKLKVGG